MLSKVLHKDGILSKNDGLLAQGRKYAAFQYLVPPSSRPGIAPRRVSTWSSLAVTGTKGYWGTWCGSQNLTAELSFCSTFCAVSWIPCIPAASVPLWAMLYLQVTIAINSQLLELSVFHCFPKDCNTFLLLTGSGFVLFCFMWLIDTAIDLYYLWLTYLSRHKLSTVS